MPLYEYDCLDCGVHFDQLRPMAKADANTQCPECGGSGTTRSLSVIAAPKIGKDSHEVGMSSAGCACGGACACGGH